MLANVNKADIILASQPASHSLKPIIRWCGGKSKLATSIINKFPQHTCYVEPFCGGAAVFLKKQRSHCEVINDINGELVNLYS